MWLLGGEHASVCVCVSKEALQQGPIMTRGRLGLEPCVPLECRLKLLLISGAEPEGRDESYSFHPPLSTQSPSEEIFCSSSPVY